MKHKVIKKQKNSKLCFACGQDNPIGTRSFYYELDNGDLIAEFFADELYQSYPGRLHGGIAATMLDETIGRAIMIHEPDMWGLTTKLEVVYKKPIPLNKKIRVIGRITKNTRRAFDGEGEILLPNGEIAVTAKARYFKMSLDEITDTNILGKNEMFVVKSNRPLLKPLSEQIFEHNFSQNKEDDCSNALCLAKEDDKVMRKIAKKVPRTRFQERSNIEPTEFNY